MLTLLVGVQVKKRIQRFCFPELFSLVCVISLVKDYLPLNSAYCFYLLCIGFPPWLYPREKHPKPKGYFQVAAMTIKHLSGEIMAILGS